VTVSYCWFNFSFLHGNVENLFTWLFSICILFDVCSDLLSIFKLAYLLSYYWTLRVLAFLVQVVHQICVLQMFSSSL
jgi:hypothetical protein